MVKTEGIIALISAVRDKANKYLGELLKKRGIDDISTPYGGIFVNLFKAGELSMGELAKRIDRDKSTVTTLVKRLVELGYLETNSSPSDSRVTMVRLTERGGALEHDFNDISNDLLAKVYNGFSDLEKEILVQLLMKVNNNF